MRCVCWVGGLSNPGTGSLFESRINLACKQRAKRFGGKRECIHTQGWVEVPMWKGERERRLGHTKLASMKERGQRRREGQSVSPERKKIEASLVPWLDTTTTATSHCSICWVCLPFFCCVYCSRLAMEAEHGTK